MKPSVRSKYSPALCAKLMERETSIRADIDSGGRGRIVTMGFPGLAFGAQGDAYLDPERMRHTLWDPVLDACDVLVVLVELEELPEDGMTLLRSVASERSIAVTHLPIRDCMAPGAAFEQAWAELSGPLHNTLTGNRTVALACHYGAGRSGMIAVGLLLERGMSLENAVSAIRKQFPDSIESRGQMAWLEKKARQRAK